jgi:SAM-dependent methyltransferase
MYRPLADRLAVPEAVTLLDAGCGVGWLANTAAFWYPHVRCLGVDFTAQAIERAEAVAALLGVADRAGSAMPIYSTCPRISAPGGSISFPVWACCTIPGLRRAVEIVSGMVRKNGYLLLGLYHRYGRKPLLDVFEPYRQRLSSCGDGSGRDRIVQEAVARWNELFPHCGNEVFNRSWFRDQCLHPHETQWTLADVLAWFERLGIAPLATSLDRFSDGPDWKRLVSDEKGQEQLARKRLFEERKFFPGFFVVWGRKE